MNFIIKDSNWGTVGSTQSIFSSLGGGYFSLPSGVSQIATCPSGTRGAQQPCIVRSTYGSGKTVFISGDPGLRGDTTSDWIIWDNSGYGTQSNSIGAWSMLGRMIQYVHNGVSTAPTITVPNLQTGKRVALVADHRGGVHYDASTGGGAWAGLLPGIARAINDSGQQIQAINFATITGGGLVNSAFDVVVFPGGYAYGYEYWLSGSEPKIRSFVSNGGSYLGVCAGAFYAASTVIWDGTTYDYPLDLFTGSETGPITDIAPDEYWALTPVSFVDSTLGLNTQLQSLYYGGGYKSIVSGVTTFGTYAYTGSASGKPSAARFTYGSGHVALTDTHNEARIGNYVDDWLYWDGWMENSTTPISSTDNGWVVYDALFEHWL